MIVINPIRTENVLSVMRDKQYTVFTRPYEMNIIGFRAARKTANQFDDKLHLIFKSDKNKWVHHLFEITTDPGTYWLSNPMNAKGTAILKEGQYRNAYQVGLHGKKKVKALVQRGNKVTVFRDYNRDNILDFNNGVEDTGFFGINIHTLYNYGTDRGEQIYRESAGCQVFSKPSEFVQEFLPLCDIHRERYGNRFSYSLIDHRSRLRLTKTRFAVAATVIGE